MRVTQDDSDHFAVAAALSQRAKAAAPAVAVASTAQKNAVLHSIAVALGDAVTRAQLLLANQQDVNIAQTQGMAPAMLDRLLLNDARLHALQKAVLDVAALPDPVGVLSEKTTQPSGIDVARMQVPLGVILMVYESRPNVTIDAAVLCLKAGNAVVLRGGKEAHHTNIALAHVVQQALVQHGLPADAVVLVTNSDRALLVALLQQRQAIDVCIPRGGTGLIDAVNAHARMPVIQHYQGICHVYVHHSADLAMAERVVVNAKVQRPGVCNAAEGLLIDAAVAPVALPRLVDALLRHHVKLLGCTRACALDARLQPASEADFSTEFLALTMAVKVVDHLDDALDFVRVHGSHHSEAIVARDVDAQQRFVREVDASCVLVNASTRFNDGGELGLGAELGISTSKLHAYGPMGLSELCTKKFVVWGTGHTRGSPP